MTSLRFAAKQALELQATVADLESAVQFSHAQFAAAQQELGPPLANLDAALSSDLAKIIPEIQELLQNIAKTTDQVESVARIHMNCQISFASTKKIFTRLRKLYKKARASCLKHLLLLRGNCDSCTVGKPRKALPRRKTYW